MKPIAVLISDIHFNLQTKDTAYLALMPSIHKAIGLNVPLIIAGDLHDTKANIRAECIENMLIAFNYANTEEVYVHVLVGNHDKVNEKSSTHALEFLAPFVHIVDAPYHEPSSNIWMLPYFSDGDDMIKALADIPKGSTIICHQGVQGAYMGEYQVDKSSLPKEVFADYRVISGHYHRRQDIKCGRPRKGAVGLFSYLGNPYSLSFAEANDPPKGFQILHDNGLLEFVPTNLRKHIIEERTIETLHLPIPNLRPNDLVWLKVRGPYSELARLKKTEIGQKLLGHSNFKFEKIALDAETSGGKVADKVQTEEQILDGKIDSLGEELEQKNYLKKLWRELV